MILENCERMRGAAPQPRILACCRVSVREADILPLWLAHYRPIAAELVVLDLVEPGDDVSSLRELCKTAGAHFFELNAERFDANAGMRGLRKAVETIPADWVIHADSDELLYEAAELPAIIELMEQEGADYAVAWMADRLAPGGKLAGLERIRTVADLEAAFPARAAVTQYLAKGNSMKVCLSRWPLTGWMHDVEEGQSKKGSRRLTLEHFKWRAGLEERLRKRIRDHEATGVPWGDESARLLEELKTHGRIRAERWLAPRCRRLHGWMNYEDVYYDAVIAAREGAHFVEVGVWQGRSICYLAEVMLACGKQLRLDGIDPFRNFPEPKTGYPDALRPLVTAHSWLDVVSSNLRRQGMLDYVNLIQAASPAAAGMYADGSLDFVWIDGAHDRASVEADCRAWWPKIRPGGTMAGHDFDWPEVRQGVMDAQIEDGWLTSRGVSFVIRKPAPVSPPAAIPDEEWKAGNPVCLAMATDANGFAPNATVIASALRRTKRPIHVRMWLRGTTAESFECGRLRVEFRPSVDGLNGTIPGHCSQSLFDRLLVLRDCADWDRAIILDYDQLVLCDIAELYDTSFDGKLLAARLWHRNLGDAARDWFGRALPEGWRQCESYPFFYMGPLLDLAGARAAGVWDKLVDFHRVAMMEEQIALTIACGGRIKALDAKWNLVPQWDKPENPIGVLHFTGPFKPWQNPDVPCAEYWRQESTAWEDLRNGAGQQ